MGKKLYFLNGIKFIFSFWNTCVGNFSENMHLNVLKGFDWWMLGMSFPDRCYTSVSNNSLSHYCSLDFWKILRCCTGDFSFLLTFHSMSTSCLSIQRFAIIFLVTINWTWSGNNLLDEVSAIMSPLVATVRKL